jgi:hypothetical protein
VESVSTVHDRTESNPNLNALDRVRPNKIKKIPKKFLRYCVLFEKLVFKIIQWHYIIILGDRMIT